MIKKYVIKRGTDSWTVIKGKHNPVGDVFQFYKNNNHINRKLNKGDTAILLPYNDQENNRHIRIYFDVLDVTVQIFNNTLEEYFDVVIDYNQYWAKLNEN